MKLERRIRKTKIIFEYSNKSNQWNFDTGSTNELNIKVFLKNGNIIQSSEIESFTINAKSIEKIRDIKEGNNNG